MPAQTMLIRAREGRGWNQKQAAAELRIDKTYLNKIEAGSRVPSPKVIAQIAEGYGLDVAALMKELLSK